MVGELLTEIMNASGVQVFNFDLAETTSRLNDFLDREKYFVFVARSGSGNPVGFIALYENAKRSLYQAIVTNLESFGIPRDHVKILLREVEKENWGIRGGQAGCDVDLGFKIDV